MNKLPDVVNFRNLSWLPPLLDTFGLNRHLCIMQKEFARKFFCPKFLKKRPKVLCPKFFCRNFSVRKFSILMYAAVVAFPIHVKSIDAGHLYPFLLHRPTKDI